MTFHKAIDIKYLRGTAFEMTFQDGQVKRYDMQQLFDKYPQLKALRRHRLFRSGRLTSYGVIWNDDLDLSAETVYEDGEMVGTVDVPSSASVAYAVTTARVNAGLSQIQLAKKSGINQADISKIERGLANPSVATLQRLADAIGARLQISLE